MVRLMIILFVVAVLSTFANAVSPVNDPQVISCVTNAKGAVYGIKTINVWFLSEDKIKVTYDDLYGMDDLFYRDSRDFQDGDGGKGDFTSYHIDAPDLTKYPEGPLSPLKLEKKMLDRLFGEEPSDLNTSGDAFGMAAAMRRERLNGKHTKRERTKTASKKIRGKLILRDTLGRDVTYFCLQR